MPNDGLNNLKSLGVRIVDVEYYALFTHLSIHVGKQGELWGLAGKFRIVSSKVNVKNHPYLTNKTIITWSIQF